MAFNPYTHIYHLSIKNFVVEIHHGHFHFLSTSTSNRLDWINNVIDEKKETEQLLIDTSQFVVSIDTKWRSHPPPLATPREEDLYCLGIVKKEKDSSSIATLRDLRGEHIPMLNNLQKDGLAVIEKIYGIQSDQIRCYDHYQPQFYLFCVFFTRLENKISAAVERGHLLIDITQNLDLFSENVSLRIGHFLVNQIW